MTNTSNMYKSEINIGKNKKTVVCISHKMQPAKENLAVNQLHHIHVLDRSGSMSDSINQLIDNVEATLEKIDANDFVSVLWFSGKGQHKTVIKGAKNDESLKTVLNSLRSTVGLTCFSEVLHDVNEIIADLAMICPNFNVTFFTDGCPVVDWSIAEEEKRIFSAIELFKNKVIALNTVGYGWYYNQDLLRNMAQQTEFGQFIHSKNINEYMDIWSQNFDRISDLVLESVKVSADNTDIMYLSRNNCLMRENEMVFSRLNKEKNQFIIISNENFEFEYNGETFNSKDIKKSIPDATQLNILYAYAYLQYYNNNRQFALDIIGKNINDKFLVDKQINAFTVDEVGTYSAILRRNVFQPKNRFKTGKCSADYIPADDALCVMDVLQMLADGDAFYTPTKNYKRITAQKVDTFNLFEMDKKEFLNPISSFTFNKEKLNLSLQIMFTGKVKINPVEAKQFDLPKEINANIYRYHTIIKDGNLNMEKITVVADGETLAKLQGVSNDENNLVENVADFVMENGKEMKKFEVNFENIPVINRLYIKDCDSEFALKSIEEELELQTLQKVVNDQIKLLKANDTSVMQQNGFANYNEKQIEILIKHGLNDKMTYNALATADAVPDEEKDSYETRALSMYIKGRSTIPSLNAVEKKITAAKEKGKEAKLNENESMLKKNYDYIMGLSVEDAKKDMEILQTQQQEVRRKLFKLRVKLNTAKMAKVLTGDNFKGELNDKNEYEFTKDGKTLIIKTEKETVLC